VPDAGQFVPSRDPIQRSVNILENIALIEQSRREWISEAAKKLGELEGQCQTVPWSNLRALGDFLRDE
jgi:hypothetical protein